MHDDHRPVHCTAVEDQFGGAWDDQIADRASVRWLIGISAARLPLR